MSTSDARTFDISGRRITQQWDGLSWETVSDVAVPPQMYAVTVNVERLVGGWVSSFGLPTFYLNANVQGILSEEQAVNVARTIVDNMHTDDGTVKYHITAVAL